MSAKTVVISEWARRSAHELDDWRDRWLASKEKDIYLDPSLFRANIKGDLDHEEIFSDPEITKRYYSLVLEDVHLLQNYLTKLKAGKLGGGMWKVGDAIVRKRQYEIHRSVVTAELNYKHQFLSKLKHERQQERQSSVWNQFVLVAEECLEPSLFRSILTEAKSRVSVEQGDDK